MQLQKNKIFKVLIIILIIISMPFFIKQIKISKYELNKSENYYEEAKSMYLLGHKIDEVISLVKKSLEYENIDENKIRNYLFLAKLYRIKEENEESFEYTYKSLELSIKIKNEILINKCIIDLGENYYIQHNYKKTIYIYEKLIRSNFLKDIKDILPVYGYLLYSYAEEENYNEFNKYRGLYLELVQKLDKIRKDIALSWLYVVCSQIEADFSNIDEANQYLKKAEEMYIENENNIYPNMNLEIEFSKIKLKYIEDKNYNKALNSYEDLLYKISDIGINSEIKDLIMDEILKLAIENKDYENLIKYVKDNSNVLDEAALQVRTDNILNEFDKMIREKEISKFKLLSIVLVILMCIMVYDRISLNNKNKEIQSLNNKLERINKIDYLTNTYNKGYLNEKLKELHMLNRNIAFIMIDIDYFKLYNDNYGHVKGDDTIIIVARLIKDVFKDDMVFRYGGEEFSVISNKSIEKIKMNLEELQSEIYDENIKHEFSRISDRITLSIGVACSEVKTEEDILNLVKIADEKLYESKEKGRNRYTL